MSSGAAHALVKDVFEQAAQSMEQGQEGEAKSKAQRLSSPQATAGQ
jgi:hypothetical protein